MKSEKVFRFFFLFFFLQFDTLRTSRRLKLKGYTLHGDNAPRLVTDRLRSCRTSFASTHRHPEQVRCFHGDDRRLWGHIEPTFEVLEAGNQTGAHDCNTWARAFALHGCSCRGFKDLTIRYRQKGSASKQLGAGGGGGGVVGVLRTGQISWHARAQNTHQIAVTQMCAHGPH